ncbi:MAG TPA: polyprenyl synthetase family protein [Ardenticatenaceae bacterium]|jgi:geranylgeranyl pyrophosphate synthase
MTSVTDIRAVKTIPLFEPLQPDLQAVLDKMRAAARIEIEGELLDEALAHVVAVGGKLVRPALTITAANIFRPTDDKLISLAASVEMLHTATLVHDDLIDDAARRRGNPTLHTLLNPASAVLLGDYLFAQAAGWAADTENIRVVHIFAEGLMTLVEGELRQMWAKFDLNRANEDYYRRIYGKTAALFAAACESGAEFGGGSPGQVQALREYGRLLGLAFQIVDDVLDYAGDAARVGKPVGGDLRNGNITLPVIIYLRDYDTGGLGSTLLQERLAPEQADEIVRRVAASPALRDTLTEAQGLVRQACDFLDDLPATPEVERLRALGDYVVQRDV